MIAFETERPAGSPRLMSILDIMRAFHPDVFVSFARVLERAGIPWYSAPPPGMIMFSATDKQDAINQEARALSRDGRARTLAMLPGLESECRVLGLTASIASLRRLRQLLTNSDVQPGQLKQLIREVHGRLVDEMDNTLFLHITPGEAEYYTNPRSGWEEIINRFPDTVSDIEEAAKCFALSRYAAAVYHSIQVVEIGLLELGGIIGVSDPMSGWTAVSNRLEQIAKTKYQDRTTFERQNHEFLEQVRATVDVLKNAWRNKISHAQGRAVLMTRDFTPDVTQEILIATRAFMRRLTDGLPRPDNE